MDKFNEVFYNVLEAVFTSFSVPKGRTLTVALYCCLGMTACGVVSLLVKMPVLINPLSSGVSCVIFIIAIILERRDMYELHRVYRGVRFSVTHSKVQPEDTSDAEAGEHDTVDTGEHPGVDAGQL